MGSTLSLPGGSRDERSLAVPPKTRSTAIPSRASQRYTEPGVHSPMAEKEQMSELLNRIGSSMRSRYPPEGSGTRVPVMIPGRTSLRVQG